jgi:hypothetical protein
MYSEYSIGMIWWQLQRLQKQPAEGGGNKNQTTTTCRGWAGGKLKLSTIMGGWVGKQSKR